MQSVLGLVRAVFAVGALLLVSGCAQTPGSLPPGLTITSDPDQTASAAHWIVYKPHYENGYLAAVADPSGAFDLGVLCPTDNRPLTIAITALEHRPDLESPSFDLSFEDGTTLASPWVPVMTDKIWSFASMSGRPGFWTAIDDLKKHKTVEATFSGSGKELRYRFSLSQADAAIGYVEKQCDPSGQT